MPKPASYPTLIDDCRTISIADLKERGYLEPNSKKSGQINWSYQGQHRASIGIGVNTNDNPQAFLILGYTLSNNEQIRYKVNLFQKPSNLGKGFVWYFMCPQTNRPCRKLYLSNGYFLHRSAMSGAMYEKQTYSKYGRALDQYFRVENGFFSIYDQMNAKHFKKYYDGKPTKKYLKLLTRIEKGKGLTPIDAKSILFKR